MRQLFKTPFKILLFFVNIIIGILVTFYLVIKFKSRGKKKQSQLRLIEDKDDNPKLSDVVAQNKRTEEVYKIVKELKEVEMSTLLAKIKGVTERTLRRDLAKLQTMKLIRKNGSTKSAKYVLTK